MSTSSSSQPVRPLATSSPSPSPSNGQARTRSSGSANRSSGTSAMTGTNPTPLRWDRQMMGYLQHITQQQAANHRGLIMMYGLMNQMASSLSLQGTLPSTFTWPSQAAFAEHIAWPGDSPTFPVGMENQEQDGDQEQPQDPPQAEDGGFEDYLQHIDFDEGAHQ